MTSNLKLLQEEIASLESLWRKCQTDEGLASLRLHGIQSDNGFQLMRKIVRLKEKERQLLGTTSTCFNGVPYKQWALCAVDARLDYAIYLVDDSALAGRSQECAIGILLPIVSRRHAALTVAGNQLLLEDLHSTNGTQVNGWPVRRQQLNDGDRVVLADVQFIVVSALITELLPPIGMQPCRDWSKRARVIQGGNQGKFLASAVCVAC